MMARLLQLGKFMYVADLKKWFIKHQLARWFMIIIHVYVYTCIYG